MVKLWPGVAPGSESARQMEQESPIPIGRVTRNVVEPTLTVYLPEGSKATGTGVIVAPGGAFRFLMMDSEGHEMAHSLVARGIAAFVLKYRVVETPKSDAEMWQAVMKVLSAPLDLDEDAKLAIADGTQALKIVRERANEWGVSPDRIGFMGFSAGAMVTSQVALRSPERLAFAAPIYGAPIGEMPGIPANMPPLFLAYASDDALLAPFIQSFYKALTDAKHHPELHIYRNGGHGFGIRKQGKSSDQWIEDFYNWLESLGMTRTRDDKAPAASGAGK
ncbi:alpha/beta hydrolase [Steroidobacter agaridevorans]|uniref:alpha/beta hydrolase n=1 Tax=Steroidobacter agaridevorans TaxID=2695856 RepID=UPI001379F744|nr:alpha/beta hydrolase [Steroidobacter agaridevorans]